MKLSEKLILTLVVAIIAAMSTSTFKTITTTHAALVHFKGVLK